MDRIFDTGSIEQICEEIKSILNDCKDHMETMRSTASEAQQAVASVPSDVRDASVDTAAEALKSAISNTDLDKIIRKLDGCRTRACPLIPAADKQYAQQTDQLAQTVAQIKDAAAGIVWGLYEIVKWGGAAIIAAPATGGGSLVGAGCIP